MRQSNDPINSRGLQLHSRREALGIACGNSRIEHLLRDKSVVNVALPAIETDLATTVVVIQWIVNAYTLSLSAFLLVGGAAGDLFGRRRIFVIGIVIFAAASVWCGSSPNVVQLILARAIQGIGAALLIPCAWRLSGQPSTVPNAAKR